MASSKNMNRVDVVALIIRKNSEILLEKRKKDRRVDPGKTVIPGGHVEDPESLEQACARELKEELDLECSNFRFVASVPHDTISEKQMVHYYSCENWSGVPKNREADAIFWTSVENLDCLDFAIDKRAVRQSLGQKNQSDRTVSTLDQSRVEGEG
jgi:8-oxo-dGTP diphosphatase